MDKNKVVENINIYTVPIGANKTVKEVLYEDALKIIGIS